MQNLIDQKLNYLFSLQSRGIKLGLHRIKALLNTLGNPEKNLRIIHVAGTNGKGSTCRIMHSILQAAGYKVGLYTSPHLIKFNERIKVGNTEISDVEIIKFIDNIKPIIDQTNATFFEITTAMAIDYFQKNEVDIAILEVGLGGRFDATNAIIPEVSVITSISMDHEDRLGNKLSGIAFEKAGIIKPGKPVFISPQSPEVLDVLHKVALDNKTKCIISTQKCKIASQKHDIYGQNIVIEISDNIFNSIFFPLFGNHQLENLATAITAMDFIIGTKLTEEVLKKGLQNIKVRGRLEVLQESPLIVYDAGHNIDGITKSVEAVIQTVPGSWDIFLAFKAQKCLKNLGEVLLKLNGKVYLTEIPGMDSMKIDELKTEISNKIAQNKIVSDINFDKLLLNATKHQENPLLIAGSHFFADRIYTLFKYVRDV